MAKHGRHLRWHWNALLRILAAIPIIASLMAASAGPTVGGLQAAPAVLAAGTGALPAGMSGPEILGPVTPVSSVELRSLAGRSVTSPGAPSVAHTRVNPDPGRVPDTITAAGDALAAAGLNFGRTPSTQFTFAGIGNLDGVLPPDTVGDVGPNHYVQMVNGDWVEIFDKTGGLVLGPVELRSLWPSGPCSTSNDGDPQVVYDSLADRWLLAQFAPLADMGICIAVSQSSDPTGLYWLYVFFLPNFPDYFKIGVWPDGYYVGTNQSPYGATVFQRSAMLTGAQAVGMQFTGPDNFLMPSDVDGIAPPPAGSPNFFYTFKDDSFHGGGGDRLEVFAFHADFISGINTTFTLVNSLTIPSFNYTVCGFFILNCIPQQGTAQKLDPVSEWPMYRFAYHNFGDHQSLVGNFTVDVSGSDRAGIRWFELQRTGTGAWSLYQQGTFAPSDGKHRFMGSINMDYQGDIALGYSLSSSSMFPAIAYTTRLSTDTLGTMQSEVTMFAGGGSQTSTSHRWGDYSAMSIDPVDGCTFWYTNEYYPTTSLASWHTRIGTFRMPNCTNWLELTPPLAFGLAEPGDIITYSLTLTNNTGITDIYTATLSSHAYTTITTSPVGLLDNGDSIPVLVVVTVPLSATLGATDMVSLTLTSQTHPYIKAESLLITMVPYYSYLPSVMK